MAAKKHYESELKKLEEIVSKLEEGDLELEEALKLFEEGVRISAACTKMLDVAQERIEMLVEGAGGLETAEYREDAFDEPEDE